MKPLTPAELTLIAERARQARAAELVRRFNQWSPPSDDPGRKRADVGRQCADTIWALRDSVGAG